MQLTINRSTLREQVIDSMRQAILDGSLPPGMKMAEADLANQFGVSRGTVREALRILHNSGLLEGSERNSLFVRRLTGRDVRELFDVRDALEGKAVATIMDSAYPAEAIRDLEEHLPRSEEGMTYAQRFELDLGFHERLVGSSGNRMLLGLWLGIKDLMRVTVLATQDETETPTMTEAHHRPIIDAMRTGDPERARAVLSAHLASAAATWSDRSNG